MLAMFASSVLTLVPLARGLDHIAPPHAAVHTSRRAFLCFAANAAFITRAANAAGNQAEEKLAEILAKKVAEREAAFGFKLDTDDINELENVLRNKYCGKSGIFSGEPGGTCAESPRAEATCFKATGFAASCSKSFDK
jgi:hypothetical protein